MHKTIRLIIAAATLLCGSFSFASHANAWGCVAEGTDGASGWSTHYKRRGPAAERALQECYAKTSESCEITDCNQDW